MERDDVWDILDVWDLRGGCAERHAGDGNEKAGPAGLEDAPERGSCDWESCAAKVSPLSVGLKPGDRAPGFGHAEISGDTKICSCVMRRSLYYF